MVITNNILTWGCGKNIGYDTKYARSNAKANMSDKGLEKSPKPEEEDAGEELEDEREPGDEKGEKPVEEPVNDEETVEPEQAGEEALGEESVEEPKPDAKKKKQNLIKGVMEYDLSDMYPEMSVLTEKKRREWDYQDPETIRAIWLESKTNVLYEYKVRYLHVKKHKKPQIEVRETTAHTLRVEHQRNKAEKAKNDEQKDLEMIEKGRESPKFDEVKLPTNATTDMRYKYIRNNPPVPRYYLEHFNKHKKPPFKIFGYGMARCKP